MLCTSGDFARTFSSMVLSTCSIGMTPFFCGNVCMKKTAAPVKSAAVVVRQYESLRWHCPNQVCGSKRMLTLSQSGSPCLLHFMIKRNRLLVKAESAGRPGFFRNRPERLNFGCNPGTYMIQWHYPRRPERYGFFFTETGLQILHGFERIQLHGNGPCNVVGV